MRGLALTFSKLSQSLEVVMVLCILCFTWGENRSADRKDALFYFPFSESTDYTLRPDPLLSASQQNLSESDRFLHLETENV